MTYTATITSKRQITLPIQLFRDLKLKQGERLVIKKTDTGFQVESQETILNRLQGSIKVPNHLKIIDVDEAIRTGKENYFKEKYSSKAK